MTYSIKQKHINKIGLIGCGRMGICMLNALLNKGYEVVVYDSYEPTLNKLKSLNVEIKNNPSEVAMAAEVILLSLPNPKALESVICGDSGLLEKVCDTHVIVDTSTVDPKTSRINAEILAGRGASFLDCPILGRPSATGKWLLPTGGDASVLDKVKPVLLSFASDVVWVGETGAGNAFKLLNQMMFSCINAISSEVMAICDYVGIDKELFYKVISSSSAATVSGLFKEVGQNIINESYDLAVFTVDLLVKDAGLALQMARESGASSMVAGTVQICNEIASANGLGNKDTSALYKFFSKQYTLIEEEK